MWFDQQDNIFVGGDEKAITDSELLKVDFLNGRTFNLKKSANKWLWQKYYTGKYQMMLKDGLNNNAKLLLQTDSYHFDLNKKGILYHTLESLNAGIYQTVSDLLVK